MNPCKVNEVWDAKLKKCVPIKPKPVPTFNGVTPKRINLKKGGTVKSKKK